ncbi:hypothetical protein ElyMa_004396000 [Elysia marginata]|uniref:Uncharacterized protein n=1 Tax=Elysia marginata TaxID=1093978 RepID=A0AAV4H9P9_9GAST|nr:hypothetical protein ElyMa_004396000 [Elysia marginata]
MNGSTKDSDDEDVQITKVVSKSGKPKKAMSWVASSFDSFGPGCVHSDQINLFSKRSATLPSVSSKKRAPSGTI